MVVLLHSNCGLLTEYDPDFWLAAMTEGDSESDSDSDSEPLRYSSETNYY